MNLKTMPKVELHVHLDGSVRLDTMCELSGLSSEEVRKQAIAPPHCTDLNDYLTKFSLPVSLMQKCENLKRIMHELVIDMARENVIYAEVRFAPLKHVEAGLTPEEVIEAVLAGFDETLVQTNLILCMMRGDTIENNRLVIDLAKKFRGNGVVAVDLAGAEALYQTAEYQVLFEYAKQNHVPFTIHAGEAAGPDSIRSALQFQTLRLGHGVRAVEDVSLMKRLKEHHILLEICPTSNVQTNIISEYARHPIAKLYSYGCNISINTDNRTVSNITLTEEYQRLATYFHFTLDDFVTMNLNAIQGSFLSTHEKKVLQEKYLNIYKMKNKI